MNLKFIFAALLFSCPFITDAQARYWQQKVDNNIKVTLDDHTHVLRGSIHITYQNNSPDTLGFIYFHLYPNAYSTDRTSYEKQSVENGNTKHYFSDEEDRGFIDSLKFTVTDNGNAMHEAGLVATKDADIVKLILPEPLLPGSKINIETPFRVKIPLTFSRMGHVGQSYQISQWFPKPAVYDAKGWHPMPYLDQGEFYSEFGYYSVAVTLPENYIIMGTGNILEHTEQDWLDSLSKIAGSYGAEQRKIKNDFRKDTSGIVSSGRFKTVTFEEDHIHDFAWFADKRWVVRKDTVAVPGADNTITAYSCYLPYHKTGWDKSLEYIKAAITEYSNAVGPYPYKTVKAVEGALSAGGGMEYPTITVISASNSEKTVRTAVVHEVGHNWFYGMLGSNERSYPWMDEGINSFYERKFAPLSSSVPGQRKDDDFLTYAAGAATHGLVPADTAADLMPELNYISDIYGKSGYLLAWLEAYVGEDHFRVSMKEYFHTWQYKHPQPADFRAIFQKHSGRNLDWFFDGVMKSTRSIDFAIKSVKKENGITVTVKNKTGLYAPAQVLLFEKNSKDSVSRWTAPFKGNTKINFEGINDYRKIKISDAVPDYNIRNNENKVHFSLKPFLGLNMDLSTKMWIAPAIGYNYYDGFMAGIVLHNFTIPQYKLQFAAVPLYTFGSGTFAGTGIAGYTIYFDQGWLHDIQINVEGKTFSYDKTNMNIGDYMYARFAKVAPELIFNIRKREWRSTVERSLSIKGYWIREELFAFNQDPADSLYYPSKGGYEDHFYGKIRYQHKNERTFNPFSYTFEGQAGKQFAKLSLEANLRIDYFKKNKALYLRGYAGKFFSFSDNDFDSYRYRIANTYSGPNDYLYDETYGGRNEQAGFWSQQISMKEGGFKVNTLQYAGQLGLSDNWLFAVNVKTDIPVWNLPVRLFADVATFANAKQQNPSGAAILYEAGVEIYLGEYLSIYLPLVLSKDFNDYTKSVYTENRFLKTISFSLNIGNINWMKLPGKILKM